MINLHPAPGPRLTLHLMPSPDGLTVRASLPNGSPSPKGAPLEASLNLPALEDVRRRASQPIFHEAIGRDLFRALFPGALGDLYRDTCAAAAAAGETITLELAFAAGTSDVGGYPWELLHDGTRFLLQSGAAALVRSVPAHALPQPTTPRAPLELLVASANPAGRGPARSPFDALNRALAPVLAADRVDVAALVPPTWDALREWTLAGAPDVLHIVSSGSPFALEDARHMPDPLPAEDWGALLAGSRLGLAVLAGADVTLAPALIQAGLPAVITLAPAIPDEEVERFVAALYTALFGGAALEETFTLARGTLTRTTVWSIPTLTCRAALPAPEAVNLPRRVDSIAPRRVPANQVFRAGLWLLPPDAPPPTHHAVERLLGYAPGSDAAIPVQAVQAAPGGFRAGLVQVEVEAEDCAIHADHGWTLAAWPDQDALPLWFAVTPYRAGPLEVRVTLSQEGEIIAVIAHPVEVVAAPGGTAVSVPEGVQRSHSLTRREAGDVAPEADMAAPAATNAAEAIPATPPAPKVDVLDLLREAELLTTAEPPVISSLRASGEHAAIQRDLTDLEAMFDAADEAGDLPEIEELAAVRVPVEHTRLRTAEIPVFDTPGRQRVILLVGLLMLLMLLSLTVLVILLTAPT